MPKTGPLHSNLKKYLKKRNLQKKFNKQIKLLRQDVNHPSLHTEILEPRKLRIFSFRIDKKYRAIFIYRKGEIEIIDINPHYE